MKDNYNLKNICKKYRPVIIFILIIILFILFLTFVMNMNNKFFSNEDLVYGGSDDDDDWGTLTGAKRIFPSVMVNEKIYKWYHLSNDLPENCQYYGEIIHLERETPTNNCEFVSTFQATGKIYILPDDDIYVYICMTTDWMSDRIVVLELAD